MGGAGLQDFLLTLPKVTELSYRAHILLILHFLRNLGQTQVSPAELAEEFDLRSGLPKPPYLDDRLRQLSKGKTAPLVAVSKGVYSLSLHGLEEISRYLSSEPSSGYALDHLKKLVGKLTSHAEQDFLSEAAACVACGAKRAAMVMVWLLTVDHLQEYVLARKLADFNLALKKRTDSKGLQIAKKDDFCDIRDEATLIQLLRSAGIITNDVRKILEEKLGFRNTCAHPSTVVIPEAKVTTAIEDLVYNVILKYPI